MMRFHAVVGLILILLGVALAVLVAIFPLEPARASWLAQCGFTFAIAGVIVASVGVAAGRILAEIRKLKQ